MNIWTNDHSAKQLFGQMAIWLNDHQVNRPFGKMTFGQTARGQAEFDQTTVGQTVPTPQILYILYSIQYLSEYNKNTYEYVDMPMYKNYYYTCNTLYIYAHNIYCLTIEPAPTQKLLYTNQMGTNIRAQFTNHMTKQYQIICGKFMALLYVIITRASYLRRSSAFSNSNGVGEQCTRIW